MQLQLSAQEITLLFDCIRLTMDSDASINDSLDELEDKFMRLNLSAPATITQEDGQ